MIAWSNLTPDNHDLYNNIDCVSQGTYSLLPLVEIPALQQEGGYQEPLGEWTTPPLECQEVTKELLEILDDLWQQGSCIVRGKAMLLWDIKFVY